MPLLTAEKIKKELNKFSDKIRAKNSLWFFKCGKGEYGEGDKFIGVTVPNQRKIAKKFTNSPLSEIEKLLKSPIHEHRLTGLIILTYKYEKTDETEQKKHIISTSKISKPLIIGILLIQQHQKSLESIS